MATVHLSGPHPERHREACIFGPGFWKIRLNGGIELTYNTFEQAEDARMRLPQGSISGLSRDGYCLDPQDFPDVVQRPAAAAPPAPTVDAELWLGLPKEQQMATLGITSERAYERTLAAAEEMVAVALNRQAQTGVKVSVVLKRRGVKVVDL